MQSGMLPDRLTHPMMYTSERAQGVRRYLNSAHIKTQPGAVASSKLVPFEIQQTLQSPDEPVCVIRLPVGLRLFSQSRPDIYHLHGQICDVSKAPKC